MRRMRNGSLVNNHCTFLQQRAGSVYMEFTVLASLFFTLLFGVVEFTYAMWQWNAATKAVEAGVRLAVVSDPGPVALREPHVTTGTTGNRVSASAYAYTCGGDGSGGCDAAAMNRIVTRMQRFMPSLQPNEVEVRYVANGLAISGSHGGLVPTVEVRIVNKQLATAMLGFLGIDEIALPTVGQSMIAEDLKSTYP